MSRQAGPRAPEPATEPPRECVHLSEADARACLERDRVALAAVVQQLRAITLARRRSRRP